MIDPKEFIRMHREHHGYTQQAVADLLDIPVKRYGAYELGYARVPIDVVIRLRDIYEYETVDQVLQAPASKSIKPDEQALRLFKKYLSVSADVRKVVDFALGTIVP